MPIRSLDGSTPEIHPTAFISEMAYVVGNVKIGEGSSVWPGAVVRGDMGTVIIGKNTNIQDNSVIHSDANIEIGDNVTIAHNVLCHAKLVGNGVVLGNGATVNDGVTIGEYCFIASGAMIVDEVVIPENSLVVGIPAKVLRQVSQRHLDKMKWYNDVYIEKAQKYKAEGNLESERP